MWLEVKLYDLDFDIIPQCTRVVCVSKYKDKFIFVKHKERDTWEIPGGHIEDGEDWLTAGKREMYEETGALDVDIEPICLYSISTYGLLCFANVKSLGNLPQSEIEKIGLFENIPDNVTYPSHNMFFEKVRSVKKL